MSDLPPPPPPSTPPPPPPLQSMGVPPNVPPGYTAYATSPLTGYAKRIGGLAKALQILVVCVLVMNVISLVVTLGVRGTLTDYLNGDAELSDAEGAIGAIAGAGLVAGLLQIAATVLTIIWMYRLACNHRLLGRSGSTWAPGWAIGGWFCPPVLFVIPWLMFRELWKGSAPNSPPHDPNWKQNPVAPIVNLWWVLYGLAGVVISGFQFASAGVGSDVDDAADFYQRTAGWSVVGTTVTIGAGVAYLLLVRGLTSRQRTLTGEQ